jgi:hypothetical protein
MNTYRATVRVPVPGSLPRTVWAQTSANNPIDAKSLLEAQYGRGNVIGVPQLVTSDRGSLQTATQRQSGRVL